MKEFNISISVNTPGDLVRFTVKYSENYDRLKIVTSGTTLNEALAAMKNTEVVDFIKSVMFSEKPQSSRVMGV